MEIFRFDNFQQAIANAQPNTIVDLAKLPSPTMTYTTPKAPSPPTANTSASPAAEAKTPTCYIMNPTDPSKKIPSASPRPGYDGAAHFLPRRQTPPLSLDRKSNDLLQIFTADLAVLIPVTKSPAPPKSTAHRHAM